jgi:hypothetical protein
MLQDILSASIQALLSFRNSINKMVDEAHIYIYLKLVVADGDSRTAR